ncbi:MAG: CvpA family protein [bacterium]
MHWVDIVVAVIIGMSMLIGLFRGLIKESMSLATWILGIWLGLVFSTPLAENLPVGIESLTVKTVIAFVVIFLVVLLLGGILNYIAGQLIDKTGLSGTDRVLGMVFGVLRGGLVVAVLVLLANLTNMPQEAWWQESLSLPYFNDIAIWIRDIMPESVASHFS